MAVEERTAAGAAGPRGKKSRAWLWFFAILGGLCTVGITAEVWFNLNQQLSPERLEAARQTWREKGPWDYVLEYAVKREYNPDPAGRTPEKYTVEVRDGRVVSIAGADGRPAPPGEFEYGGMDDLFDAVGRKLQEDRAAGGPRPFVKATFQKATGAIVHYVRSVMRTRERLEVSVQVKPAEPNRPPAGP